MQDDPNPATIAEPSLGDTVGGAALGALLGLLMGFSVSPVVAGVITGLVALMGGVFGFSDKLATGPSPVGMRRLSALAIAAVLVTPAAIWVRTHDLLGVSMAEHQQTLDELKINDPQQRLEWLRFLRFGIVPDHTKVTERTGVATGLYADAPTSPFCQQLISLEARDGSNDADFAKVLAEHNAHTKEIAQRIGNFKTARQKQEAYRLASTFLCVVAQ